jgi:hypothetical protein
MKDLTTAVRIAAARFLATTLAHDNVANHQSTKNDERRVWFSSWQRVGFWVPKVMT